MAYSLAAKFATETISSALAMYFGLGVVANDHLRRTKGSGFGFGFIALGFGMAFALPLVMFNFVSAHLNPAMCTALWIAGVIDGADFGVATAGEYLGMFVGALLVYVHYWPHFSQIPGDAESPATEEELEADSKKKLAVFATGTAVKAHWLHTFYVEFVCTLVLVASAMVVYARKSPVTDSDVKLVYRCLEGLTVGWLVFVSVLGLGGVTSIAANPARDLSPRLLHFVAPISNKGSSNWRYALVPFFACNLGGIAAGFVARGIFSLTGYEM